MVMEQAIDRTAGRPGGPLAVSTTGLTKRFGDRTVVQDVALAIGAGSVCGFVGPNGAGKTTTIRMLLGLVRPTSGRGTILGGSLRLAARNGITLRQLAERTRSLERAFFALTGTQSADVPDGPGGSARPDDLQLGAIR